MSYRSAEVAWAVEVAVGLMCAHVVVGKTVEADRVRMRVTCFIVAHERTI